VRARTLRRVKWDVDVRNPRVLQGIATGVILLGFVVDWRPIVLVAAIGLAAVFAAHASNVRRFGRTWVTEEALLVLSMILFVLGRAGWAWLLAMLAAGVAAMAAIANVWIAPADAPPAGPATSTS
jgi:uncharacterized membrane protein